MDKIASRVVVGHWCKGFNSHCTS